MSGIKRTPADAAFSNCTRERSNWTCERCGAYFPEGRRGGLDCSHHHGRGAWSIRFDPLNSESLCYGCHSHVGGTEERRKEVLTEWEQDLLFERKADTGLGRLSRKTKGVGEVAKHYRNELKRMQELRQAGETGRIEFESFF
jgi:hypothetical protein